MKSRIILKTHHVYSALNTRGVFVGHPLTSFEKLRGRQFRWYPFFCKVASLVCNFSKVWLFLWASPIFLEPVPYRAPVNDYFCTNDVLHTSLNCLHIHLLIYILLKCCVCSIFAVQVRYIIQSQNPEHVYNGPLKIRFGNAFISHTWRVYLLMEILLGIFNID